MSDRQLARLIAILSVFKMGCAPEVIGNIQADLANVLSSDQRHIFISKQAINGNIKGEYGSLNGACATFAEQSGLKRTYRPIITDSEATASERVGASGPIYLVNRNFEKFLVANNPSELWSGSLQRPIDLDQFGDSVPVSRAWTGRIVPDVRTCQDWTVGNGAADAAIGDATSIALWFYTGVTSDCNDAGGSGGRRLYCISE